MGSKMRLDQRCTCSRCGREIRWDGKRWEHAETGPFNHEAKRVKKKVKKGVK